jgi:hypothetical protein
VLFRALVVCSDGDCAAEFEVMGPRAELEALVCDCGAGLHVIGWPETVESPGAAGRLVLLPLVSSPE